MEEKQPVTMEATVVKHTGSHYLLSALPEWNLFPAVLRGKIRLSGSHATNPVAVGDRVICTLPAVDEASQGAEISSVVAAGLPGDGAAGKDGLQGDGAAAPLATELNPATITEVLPRKNYVIRKSVNLSRQSHIVAANLDRAFIVVTIDYPEINLSFLDRLLVTCEAYNVKATIVVNKTDLYTEEHQERLEAFRDIYNGAGYDVLEVSAMTGDGVDRLRELCKDSVSLFSGLSGVGKSSLINALDPSLQPKVGELSESHVQGRHTTTFYEMYKLSSGGFIIDTPGIRGFGLMGFTKEEIACYFPEMLRASRGCKFTPCTHTHEPGCAVKAAVEDGTISYDRYCSYLGMLDEETKYR